MEKINETIKYLKPNKKIRVDVNYAKEGFSQLFPILRIKNDKEIAWIFGFGKKNIAFVSGENDSYRERNRISTTEGLIPKFTGTDLNKLNYKQKVVLAVVAVGFIGVVYFIYRGYKNRR